MPFVPCDVGHAPYAHHASADVPEAAHTSAHATTAAPTGLVDARGCPTPAAVALVEQAANVLHIGSPFAPSAGFPHRLSEEAFAAFKRPLDVERKDPVAYAAYEARWDKATPAARQQLLHAFSHLGAFCGRNPETPSPDVVAVYSATVPTTRARIASLAAQVEAGTLQVGADTQVFLLGGERKLFSTWTEPESVLREAPGYALEPHWQTPEQWPTTEIGATQMVWQQQLLPSPLRAAHVTPLVTPTPSGRLRAHGSDVAAHLVAKLTATPRSILVVSTAPFVESHVLAVRLALRRRGMAEVEVCGMGEASAPAYWTDLTAQQTLGILFDNLAGTFNLADQLHAP